MLDWLKKHSKTLNFFGGILILIITVIIYFWTITSESVVVTGGKSAQEKRMDRSTGVHSNTIVRKSAKKPNDMSVFSKKIKEGKQAQNLVLIMMFLGFMMVGSSLYTKYKEQKQQAD